MSLLPEERIEALASNAVPRDYVCEVEDAIRQAVREAMEKALRLSDEFQGIYCEDGFAAMRAFQDAIRARLG